MKPGKRRLSASVDAELLTAAETAAAKGEVANVSAWVNEAMALKLEHDRGLAALAAFVAEFEAESGPISEEEVEAAVRNARGRAIPVRGMRAHEGQASYTPRPTPRHKPRLKGGRRA